jgi:hypothetical protein
MTGSIFDKFYAETERDFSAPSGIVYRIKIMEAIEHATAVGGVPSLAGSTEASPGEILRNLETQRVIGAAGVTSMTWNGETEPGPIDPNRIPFCDVGPLFMAVGHAADRNGEADQARRLFREAPAAGPDAGRSGAEVSRDAVESHS